MMQLQVPPLLTLPLRKLLPLASRPNFASHPAYQTRIRGNISEVYLPSFETVVLLVLDLAFSLLAVSSRKLPTAAYVTQQSIISDKECAPDFHLPQRHT